MTGSQKISQLPTYTTPNDVDIVPIVDTTNAITKSITWAFIKSVLNTYFATIYATISGTQTLTNKTLTTPIVNGMTLNIGSDAIGDIYYRKSDGTIGRLAAGSTGQVVTSTGVGAVPSYQTPTAVVNGSSSVAGVFQEATAAQINTATAAGSTGADLTINPAQLALSAPAFNGQNLSNLNVQTIPLGEAFTGATTPQPAVIINDLLQSYVDDGYILGRATNGQQETQNLAISITPRSNVTAQSILLYLAKQGTPTGNISVQIQTDSSGSPSNTPITNGTSNNVAASGIVTSFSLVTIAFASAFSLVAGTKYWIVIKESDNSDSNNICIAGTSSPAENWQGQGGAYAEFAGMKALSTTWSNADAGFVPFFQIIPSSGSGSFSLWRAEALSQNGGLEKLAEFAGFCITTGSAGASGTLAKGVVSGFSLLGNTDYYVSTSIGTITTDPTQTGMYVGTTNAAGTVMMLKQDKQMGTLVQHGWKAFNGSNWIAASTLKPIYFASSDGVISGFLNQSGAGSVAIAINGNTIVTAQSGAAGTWGIPFSLPVKKGETYAYTNVTAFWRPIL
jgi:hypothetical protein